MGPSSLFASEFVARLGWSLVHFLWQGALVAAGLAGLLHVLHGRSARARYLTACLALLVMTLLPLATYCLTQPPEPVAQISREVIHDLVSAFQRHAAPTSPASAPSPAPGSASASPDPRRAFAAGAPEPAPAAGSLASWGTRGAHAVEQVIPWLVLGWMLGVLLLALRQLGGLWLARDLVRRGISPVPPELQDQLAALVRRVDITRPVRLLLSSRVPAPVLIGWIKPVILLPACALTRLSPELLEAILLHELAHVRRHDYLINLFQSVVETLLFYHPAVWWVSRIIRQERECCCDDLAVASLGDMKGYAFALTRMEELRGEIHSMAMSIKGGRLMFRIRRLLGLPSQDRYTPVRWLAGAVALALGTLIFVSSLGAAAPAGSAGSAGSAVSNATTGTQKMSTGAPAPATKLGLNDLPLAKMTGDVKPAVSVELPRPLLELLASAISDGKDKPESQLVDTVKSLNLDLVSVRVYENLKTPPQERVAAVEEHVARLVPEGWASLIKVQDEGDYVHLLIQIAEKRIRGFSAFVIDGSDMVLVKVGCDADPAAIGTALRTLTDSKGALSGPVMEKIMSSIGNIESVSTGLAQGVKAAGNKASGAKPSTGEIR